jgi:hypothetical protein
MELGSIKIVRKQFRSTQLDAQEKAWRAGIVEATKNVEAALRRLEETALSPTD